MCVNRYQGRLIACNINFFLTLAPDEGGSSCVMCCCAEIKYPRVTLYTSKDRKKNIFSDDITFITLSKTCDLL